MEGGQRRRHYTAAEAQARFRRGGPGKGQPHRQTWCPISNIRQRAEILATYPASDQELGRLGASGKSLEFRAEPQATQGLRAGP